MTAVRSDIRLSAISKKGWPGMLLRIVGPLFDRLLGVRKLRKIYERHDLQGLGKFEFIEEFQRVLKLRYHIDPASLGYIPKTGPVVIVANHPLGGLEGILLALALREARPDYKIFVNIMLYFIKELEEFFIFTNPMAPGSRDNVKSLGLCRAWLREGHSLVVFPAGRVGLYREEKGYITDEAWDQIALSMGLMTKATFVPVFVGGQCGSFFSWMCRLIFPMKLLLLVREFIRSFGTDIVYTVGRPIPRSLIEGMKRRRANAYLRMRTYLLKPAETTGVPAAGSRPEAPETPAVPDGEKLDAALSLLPAGQILSQGENYLLAWCDRRTSPVVAEYCVRLRNLHGYFPPGDYDDACRHVFVYDRQTAAIIAACRLGSGQAGNSPACALFDVTDAKTEGTEISMAFCIAGVDDAVESMLWDGILRLGGAKLYGTVYVKPSPPREAYGDNSLAIIIESLTRKNRKAPGRKKPSPKASFLIAPRNEFPLRLHREVEEYLDRYGLDPAELEEIMAALDGVPCSLPFLAKPLIATGAAFVSAGMDPGSGLPVILFKMKPELKHGQDISFGK